MRKLRWSSLGESAQVLTAPSVNSFGWWNSLWWELKVCSVEAEVKLADRKECLRRPHPPPPTRPWLILSHANECSKPRSLTEKVLYWLVDKDANDSRTMQVCLDWESLSPIGRSSISYKVLNHMAREQLSLQCACGYLCKQQLLDSAYKFESKWPQGVLFGRCYQSFIKILITVTQTLYI